MKRSLLFLFIGAFMLLAACDPVDRDIKRLESIAADAKTNGANYTQGQWEDAIDEFDDITDRLNERRRDLNADDLHRISEASTTFSAELVTKSIKNGLNTVNDYADEMADFLEKVGQNLDEEFLTTMPDDDLNDDADYIDDIYDDIDDDIDD